MVGRPSKLTPETKKKLLEALGDGNHYRPACALAGISYQTFRNWVSKGEFAKQGEYLDFFDSVQKALADAEIASVAKIKKAEDKDWKAAAWMLERRYPDRWASAQRVKMEVEKEVARELEQTLENLQNKLPPAIFHQVLIAIADEDDSMEEHH